MNEPLDPNRTFDVPSTPPDALDAGLAAGFGKPPSAPRSSLDASQQLLRVIVRHVHLGPCLLT